MNLSKKLSLLLLLQLFFINPHNAFSQNKYHRDFYGGIFYLSEFIASPEYSLLKERNYDNELVDTLYNRATKFFEGDISEALLCLTFACLPYNNIKTRFLFNSQLTIPLPSPPQRIFIQRLKNLPGKIFFDSPKNDFGDKDKLSHFFGNAFLNYNIGFFNLSKFMGIFVETVEEGLFIEGGYSKKDLITNSLGELFAEVLKDNPKILPSEILKIYQIFFFRMYQ
ncbi:MAG: hypothetical protein AB1521_12205 [Bacteroidota bacterium]